MEEGRESAKMSKALVTLNADVEIDFDLEACRIITSTTTS